MKWYLVWIIVDLMLITLLGFSSISLAEEGKWTKKADMSIAREFLSTSAVDGKIYAIGGRAQKSVLSIIEEYDPATNKWTKKSNMSTARWGLSASAVKL